MNVVADAVRSAAPPPPASLAESGLSQEAVNELLLKLLYTQGARKGQEIAETICLPFAIVDDVLLRLQERRLIEVVRTSGPSRGGYVFELTSAGRERAQEALASSQYVGPAPVPLSLYRACIDAQSVRQLAVTRERVRSAFAHLVLPDTLLESLGPAIASGSSVFLHGEPGNGKTVIAEAMATLLGGDIYIPRTVDIDGQLMSLFDPVHHQVVEHEVDDPMGWVRPRADHDRRFVRIRRPVIFVGGELSLDQLDLRYDATTRTYQAPFQLKAAGGLLIIDDFGRQLVEPHDLLNRWIVPLEKRVDYLTLHTGGKFPVPFDCLIVFATNLDPEQLVDEAFLRRIQFKLSVRSPSHDAYETIFQRVCEEQRVPFDPDAVRYVRERYYEALGIQPRACHPRDIVQHVLHIARYSERPPTLERDMLTRACETYFLIMARPAMARAAGEVA